MFNTVFAFVHTLVASVVSGVNGFETMGFYDFFDYMICYNQYEEIAFILTVALFFIAIMTILSSITWVGKKVMVSIAK